MNCYNEFSVGKCGNADLYFLVDTEYAEEISQLGYKHTQNVKEILDAFLIEMEDE